jgi:hypothetical protein
LTSVAGSSAVAPLDEPSALPYETYDMGGERLTAYPTPQDAAYGHTTDRAAHELIGVGVDATGTEALVLFAGRGEPQPGIYEAICCLTPTGWVNMGGGGGLYEPLEYRAAVPSPLNPSMSIAAVARRVDTADAPATLEIAGRSVRFVRQPNGWASRLRGSIAKPHNSGRCRRGSGLG